MSKTSKSQNFVIIKMQPLCDIENYTSNSTKFTLHSKLDKCTRDLKMIVSFK